jgi:hypothetical protein
MRDWLAPVVGVGALGFFAGMTLYMLRLVGVSEQEWSRAVYVFSGVQAVAFAATGFFFGREVHRGRADTAEREREAARTAAREAERRGGELARAVRGLTKPESRFESVGRGDGALRLIELADRLFPGEHPVSSPGEKGPSLK